MKIILPITHQKHIAFILWIVFFCYAICAALIFQKILLPHLSSIQTGSGLISNDATYFDSVATTLANEIKVNGWSSWRLYPTSGAPGNVAILGALYVFFGHDPSLAIPLNAALHAMGGLLIFLLARELASKESIGTYAGVIAGSLFVIFPSSLVWYGQNHKDSYAIAGTLLILFVWVKALKNPMDNRSWYWLILGNLIAITLVGIVRPFGLKLLLVAVSGILIPIVTNLVFKWKISANKKMMGFFLIVVLMLLGAIKTTFILGGSQSDTIYANWQSTSSQSQQQWRWTNSKFLPDSIENYIETAAKTRAGLIVYGVGLKAKSMIDEDIAPQNIVEATIYLPRAMQVSLFAPFPSSWLANISMTRLIAVGEMFIYYLCAPGILILLFYERKPILWMVIYFACFFLLVYGFTQANLGTLYRYRYAYQLVLLMLGVLGWCTWLDKTGRLRLSFNLPQPPIQSPPPLQKKQSHELRRKETMSSGVIVIGLTLLTFVGFFIRDIMMAKTFGLGVSLDSFFIALLIPMFLVTILCMPLGNAFVPFYLDIKERLKSQYSRELVSGVSFWTIISLLIICLILYPINPILLPLLNSNGSPMDMQQLIPLLHIALLILLFSGTVILGNSVLNANGRSVLTSTAQLVVPVTAILALVLFGNRYGVMAAMYGMVVGQLLNLLILQYYLGYYDVTLRPKLNVSAQAQLTPLLRQYMPLAVSAFFIAAASPVATLLAISLPEGGVSAFNLGNKVVLFCTGLVSTAVSTVMLPYFSGLVAKNHLVSARRELSFFLLLATFVSVPISAALYLGSTPIIRLMFEGGTFDSNATGSVARVMQYAVVQIPFFVCNSLLLKFATATKHVFAINAVALVGLLINIGASILLMKYMGVAGIALGASISMLFSTVLLVLVLVRYWDISRFDALIMMLNWLLFVTLLVCLHFQNNASVYVTIFAYVILLFGYFDSLKSDKKYVLNEGALCGPM
ncbi:MAG: lipid II flippase MurJ [Methylococcaceae bacterium]